MLLSFQRPDDNGVVHINPAFVSSVFVSMHDDRDVTIIRMSDGRGFRVLGTVEQVMTQLQTTVQ